MRWKWVERFLSGGILPDPDPHQTMLWMPDPHRHITNRFEEISEHARSLDRVTPIPACAECRHEVMHDCYHPDVKLKTWDYINGTKSERAIPCVAARQKGPCYHRGKLFEKDES